MAARLGELEKAVDRLAGIAPGYYYGEAEIIKRKRGSGKRVADAELFRSRDGLVDWLEEVWPQIARPLRTAPNPRAVAAVIKGVARRKELRPPWQHRFVAHPAHLFDFLHSAKFRMKPPQKTVVDALNRPEDDEKRKFAANRLPTRRIANAMAGVPRLEWRTSLDKCSDNPSSRPVALNAARYYRAMCGVPEGQWKGEKV